MPSQKQYVAVWPSGHYLKWRGLTMREHRRFLRRLEFESEMAVFCDLYDLVKDEDESLPLSQVTAGVVDFLGNFLLRASAFADDTKGLDVVKAALMRQRQLLRSNYFESCKVIIAGIFRYTFEEIEQWDEDTFFARLAAAELLSGEDLSPKPLEEPRKPGDPKKLPPRPKKPLNSTQARALERTLAARTTG